jgi:hypothetical protein
MNAKIQPVNGYRNINEAMPREADTRLIKYTSVPVWTGAGNTISVIYIYNRIIHTYYIQEL